MEAECHGDGMVSALVQKAAADLFTMADEDNSGVIETPEMARLLREMQQDKSVLPKNWAQGTCEAQLLRSS